MGSVTSIPRMRLFAEDDKESGKRKTPFEMLLYRSGWFGAKKGKRLVGGGQWRAVEEDDMERSVDMGE